MTDATERPTKEIVFTAALVVVRTIPFKIRGVDWVSILFGAMDAHLIVQMRKADFVEGVLRMDPPTSPAAIPSEGPP